jgi:hypothetical protein
MNCVGLPHTITATATGVALAFLLPPRLLVLTLRDDDFPVHDPRPLTCYLDLARVQLPFQLPHSPS